jgi:hypothetical protein
MWCPNCQNEFRPGITVCPECNIPLIEELESQAETNFVKVAGVKDEVIKDKIVKYLDHLNIPNRCEIDDFNEDDVQFVISVPESKANESVNVIATIVKVESEKMLEEDPEKVMEEARKAAEELQNLTENKGFVRASEKSGNYLGSGDLFIALGVLLIVVIGLSVAGFIPFLQGTVTLILMGLIAVASLVSGTLYRKKGNALKDEVETENENEERIKNFLKENITKEILDALNDDESTPELLYLKQGDYVKDALLKEFPGLNDEYYDILTDDFLSELYND